MTLFGQDSIQWSKHKTTPPPPPPRLPRLLSWTILGYLNSCPEQYQAISTPVLNNISLSQLLSWTISGYLNSCPEQYQAISTPVLNNIRLSQLLSWTISGFLNSCPEQYQAISTPVLNNIRLSQLLSWTISGYLNSCPEHYPSKRITSTLLSHVKALFYCALYLVRVKSRIWSHVKIQIKITTAGSTACLCSYLNLIVL